MAKRRRDTKFSPLKSHKPVTSQRRARAETSRFHELARESSAAASGEAGAAALEALERRRKDYQAASVLLTSTHRASSRFVFRCVTRLGMRPARGERPLRVLEVGAVNTQLQASPFLDVTAIDVRSRHPRIRQLDLFDVPPPDRAEDRFDVVVLAMVLNCVESAPRRGEMLARCRAQLRDGGLLVLVLPLRCFAGAASRDDFDARVMRGALALERVVGEESPKVALACYRRLPSARAAPAPPVGFAGACGFDVYVDS